MGCLFREDLCKRFLTGGFNGVGGHSWELGPVPIPNTEVNLPGDLCGSVVREPTRSLDRCQLHSTITRKRPRVLRLIVHNRRSNVGDVSGKIIINVYNDHAAITT